MAFLDIVLDIIVAVGQQGQGCPATTTKVYQSSNFELNHLTLTY